MKHDVFISYSHDDIEIVQCIYEALKAARVETCIDSEEIYPGDDYATRIAKAIFDCTVLVFVWSDNSNQSKDAAKEIRLAVEYEKVIIPFKIAEPSSPSNVAYHLLGISRIDAIPFNENFVDELVAKVLKVLKKLKQLQAKIPHQTNTSKVGDYNNDVVSENIEGQAREEAERQAREEAECQAREEAERQAREEAERQACEEVRYRQKSFYKMGDYYDDGVRRGVVFEISADGRRGKIVSIKQSVEELEWSYDSVEQERLIGADSQTNGEYNMAKVKTIPGWRSKYPAFAWCADLGEGWYLPSIKELLTIYENKNLLNPKLTDKLLNKSYWSSTEYELNSRGCFCAWYLDIDNVGSFFVWLFHQINGYTNYHRKNTSRYVRAVFAFGEYKVGDYYNDGVREGVVFEVSADGRHGKIVSMKQSSEMLEWSSDSAEQKRQIGADSETDGAANMEKEKALPGWQSKYPAFKWCADLGEGWCLPAVEELHTIYINKNLLNPNLTDKLSNDLYWSSTECNEFCARLVDMGNGSTDYDSKNGDYYVRAVSAF